MDGRCGTRQPRIRTRRLVKLLRQSSSHFVVPKPTANFGRNQENEKQQGHEGQDDASG